MAVGSNVLRRAKGVAMCIVASGEQCQWRPLAGFSDLHFKFPFICRNNRNFVERKKINFFFKFKMFILLPLGLCP